jgi:cytochrome b6
MKLVRVNGIYDWLDDRLGLEPLAAHAREKVVPLHRHSIWYYFGGMTLFLFGVQVLTGMLLLLYYRPGEDTAFESVQFIIADVPFGWLIRSIHSWSANLMIATLFIHMFSVYLLKAYRSPRELTWVSGTLMFFIVLGFGFSGYLLPWNKLAFFATKVGTEVTGVVPVVGHFMARLLRGGDYVNGATLTRFYGLHISILPLAAFGVLFVHLLLIQRMGMSVPRSVEGQQLKTVKFVPNFALRDLMGWLVILALLATLATLFPWELGEKADPFASAPAGIKPEWFFIFMFQTLKFLPAKIGPVDGEVLGVVAFGVAALFWLLVPFLDRKSARGEKSPVFTLIGVIALLYITVMTVVGYLT